VRRRSPLSYGSGRHRGRAGARERLRRDDTAAASSASGLRTATRHRLGRLGDRATTAPPAPRFPPPGAGGELPGVGAARNRGLLRRYP
jgi:hypothetical protein